jgi:hypothetical protein
VSFLIEATRTDLSAADGFSREAKDSAAKVRKFFVKKLLSQLTPIDWDVVCLSRLKRAPLLDGVVLACFGDCKLELNFVPG